MEIKIQARLNNFLAMPDICLVVTPCQNKLHMYCRDYNHYLLFILVFYVFIINRASQYFTLTTG